MKLIFCKRCTDVVSLKRKPKHCECGESSGHYIDELNAVIQGNCIPLGFANSSFAEALRNQPESDLGRQFNAFVIQKNCPTIRVVSCVKNSTVKRMKNSSTKPAKNQKIKK